MPVSTIRDIASKAGVSVRTASKVFNGSKGVKPRTAQRVLDAAKSLKYRPNRAARGLISKRHGSFGLLIEEMAYIPHRTLEGILKAIRECGQTIAIESFSKSPESVPTLVEESCVDGLIVFEDVPDSLLERIDALGVPCVQVNTNRRRLKGSITYDEKDGMRMALEHFRKDGRKSPLFITSSGDPHYSVEERKAGFAESARALGFRHFDILDLGMRKYLRDEAEEYCAPVTDYLKRRPKTDCVLTSWEGYAFSAIKAAKRLGRRIPKDLSLMVMHDTPLTELLRPSLTALNIDRQELGRLAVRTLKRLVDGKPLRGLPNVVGYRIDRRDSA